MRMTVKELMRKLAQEASDDDVEVIIEGGDTMTVEQDWVTVGGRLQEVVVLTPVSRFVQEVVEVEVEKLIEEKGWRKS